MFSHPLPVSYTHLDVYKRQDVSVLTAAQRSFVGMSKFSLTAIPFFVLAGNLMNQGGIAKRLVDFVLAILGKLPGALLRCV